MRRIVAVLGVLMLALCLGTPHAICQTVEISAPAGAAPTDKPDRLEWTFTIKFSSVPANVPVELRLPLPDLITTPTFVGRPTGLTIVGSTRHGDFWEWTFKQASAVDVEFKLKVDGLKDLVRNDNVRWIAKVDGKDAGLGTTNGPVSVYKASTVRPIFGGGFSLRHDDVADFMTVTDDATALFIENDSRMRAAAIVGVLFKLTETDGFLGLGESREKRPLDLLVSLEFAQGTQRTLDGFLFGVGFGINKYVELAIGYSLRRGKELSPGFQRAAAGLVTQLKDVTDNDGNLMYPEFSRYELNSTGDSLKDDKQFDGFPLIDPRDNMRIFGGGNPVVDSFNSTFHVGIVIPVDFKGLFGLKNGS